jgi:CDP-glycerol glycerophosphotransferase (TagB/SpsB family)
MTPSTFIVSQRRRVITIATRIGFRIGMLGPVRRRVVLGASHTPSLAGNLAWIRAELDRRQPPVPFVEVTPGRVRSPWRHILFAVRSGYHLAASRVFVVDDYFFPMYVITPRAGTTRIQVWHAAGAFKKFGYSVVDKAFGADSSLVDKVAIHSNYDLALVSSMRIAPHYAEAFNARQDIFTSHLGIPRTDLFGDPERRAVAEASVRARFPQLAGRKVVLYAPTFRGKSIRRARYADLMDLDAMHAGLGDEWVVLLKLHPFVRRAVRIPDNLRDFVIDASSEPDVNELMLVADVLVTDYSSVIYEFALLARPILFLAPDEGAYDRERGFYFDFRAEAPGPIFDTTDGLAAAIAAGGHDLDRVRAFANASFDVTDGRATQRLVDRVLLPALDGRTVTAAELGVAEAEARVAAEALAG